MFSSPTSNTTILNYARQSEVRSRWLSQLGELIAFPTISALPRHRKDLQACAQWLARHLAEIGLHHIQILPGINKGAPSVYADWLLAPGKPTLLLYGHYDVQPVDPIKEWRSPPFKASIIGDNLYARGASDDKGQLFIHLKAIESYLRTNRRLPINIKMRLVPNQEPAEIAFFLQQHIARMTHPAVRSRLKISGSSRPVLLPRNSPVMLAAIRAIEQTWGIPPVFTRSGGSIPLVEQLRRSNESTDRFTWFWST